MNGNEMLDRYIHEVGRNLPSLVREDIQLELRSLVRDAVEEQAADPAQPSAKMVAAVLQEFGSPQQIAAKYHPDQGLIGPNLYPAYKLWLTIALVIMAGVHLLGLLVAILQGEAASFGSTIANTLSSFWDSAIAYVGVLTLIFAGLGRIGIDKIPWLNFDPPATWDPYQLPLVDDPNRISRGEMITGIVFAAVFVMVANFSYEALGFVDVTNAERPIVPFFTPEFARFVPWLTALWVVDTLLKVFVMAQGRWNRLTQTANVIISTLFLVVLFNIYTTQSVYTELMATRVAQGIIGVVMLVTVWEIGTNVYGLVAGRPFKFSTFFHTRLA